MSPDSLEKLLAAATPEGFAARNGCLVKRGSEGLYEIVTVTTDETALFCKKADLDLIVALRNAAPALLRLWRAAKAYRDEKKHGSGVRMVTATELDEALRELSSQ